MFVLFCEQAAGAGFEMIYEHGYDDLKVCVWSSVGAP